jgi:hypothetical protein
MLFFGKPPMGDVLSRAGRSPGEALASRVQNILGMKTGSQRYLPYVRQALDFLRARLWKRKEKKIFQSADRDVSFQRTIHRLIYAVSQGVNVEALRNKLLAALTLSGHYLSKPNEPWLYGGLWDRVVLCSYLRHCSRAMLKTDKRGRASQYSKAALLLWCQDDVLLGGASCLGDWVNTKAFPKAHQNAAALGATAEQLRHLREIYGRSLKRHLVIQSAQDPFFADGRAIGKLGTNPIPHRILQAYVAAMLSRINSTAGRLSEEYFVLRDIQGEMLGLLKNGHRKVAGEIRAVLTRWAGRVRASHRIARPVRKALLRWIEEASL